MIIARIIKLKYQLIFYLSRIRIIDFLFDDKKLTSCTNLNPPNKLWFWIMPIFYSLLASSLPPTTHILSEIGSS